MWPFMTRLRWGKLAVWTALKVKGCVFIHNSSSKDRKGEGRSHHYDFPQKNLTDYHRMAVVDDPIQCAELLILEPPRLVQEMAMFWHWTGSIIPHPLLENPFFLLASMGWNSLPSESKIKAEDIFQLLLFRDRDQDTNNGDNCARQYHGGWWYSVCHAGYPTGLQSSTMTSSPEHITWLFVGGVRSWNSWAEALYELVLNWVLRCKSDCLMQ